MKFSRLTIVAAALAEQPADVAAGEPAAEDERPALGVAVLHLGGSLQHALEERRARLPCRESRSGSRTSATGRTTGSRSRRGSRRGARAVSPTQPSIWSNPRRGSHAARVAVVDEDRRPPGLVVEVGREPADVPAVAHRPERQQRDHRVLGRVERAEEPRHLRPRPSSIQSSGRYQTASVSKVVSGMSSGTRSSVAWSRIDFFW